MPYEMDCISVKESESKKDADAILIHWKDVMGDKIVAYDGGLQAHGETMKSHLDCFYFKPNQEKVIDAVIVSHSDQDHTSGLKVLLENFTVKALYMNRPWVYAEELHNKVDDGRITVDSLRKRLREKYSYIADLEAIAEGKNIPIYETFQGRLIENVFKVLSPSKEFYFDLIVESSKTPLTEMAQSSLISQGTQKILGYARKILEAWDIETLHEDVKTSAENEMSIVLYGNMEEEGILLVGDGGLRALSKANDYANSIGIYLKNDVIFMQIPHHGGRHNISTSLLDLIVGERVKQGKTTGKAAFVCAAENSDHPLQMVVNAYVRRGVKVYPVKGNILHYNKNMPQRKDWGPANSAKFDPNVEEWES